MFMMCGDACDCGVVLAVRVDANPVLKIIFDRIDIASFARFKNGVIIRQLLDMSCIHA